MPRYLIHREFSITEGDMPRIGKRSKELTTYDFPQITWEHSHVVVDEEGMAHTYCAYEAPDVETVRRHAQALGEHTYTIHEIVGDVSPADFPLDGDGSATAA
jgi:Nickel responsive protein SCO4226-like